MAAGAAKAGLHLIGEEQAARGTDGGGGRGEEAGRIGKKAIGGKDRVHHQKRGADAVVPQVGNGGLHMGGEGCGRITVAGIGRGDGADMRAKGDTCAQRGRGFGDRGGHTVIGVAG